MSRDNFFIFFWLRADRLASNWKEDFSTFHLPVVSLPFADERRLTSVSPWKLEFAVDYRMIDTRTVYKRHEMTANDPAASFDN